MTAPPVTPGSTYRIQLQPRFTFADAAGAAPRLADLGVTHLHLSPVLEAVPGSRHGYDVVDHTRVRAELGGEQGLRDLARAAREHDMGLIADIVPNHMAVPAPEHLNAPLWAVLRDGPSSPYARWFDVDWAALDGRVLLPVLGDPLPDAMAELAVVRDKAAGGAVLRYHDHRFPLRPGTEKLPLRELLDAQWYRLAYWRGARTQVNYRRFFTISELIAVRVEDPEVFAATHATVLRLLREDVVQGLRVDHPDGLADPAGYLRRLSEACGGRWTVVEKILQRDETLPADWVCAGATGYDALDRVDGLFTDPDGVAALADFYREFTGVPDDRGGRWAATVRRAARRVITHDLAAEVSRLRRAAQRAQAAAASATPGPAEDSGRRGSDDARPAGERGTGSPRAAGGRGGELTRAAGASMADAGQPPYDAREIEEAVRELLVGVPVYRPYVQPGRHATALDTALLTDAAHAARDRCAPRLGAVVDFVRDLALGRGTGRDAADFAVRFAQVAATLHAKSVEDTAFYRYGPLLSLCEVGRDPGRPATSPQEFHAYCARRSRERPASGTVLSTHDTKRSADVRMRLAVLSEMPDAWREFMAERTERAARTGAPQAPDPHTAYTVFQTAVGLGRRAPDRLAPAVLKAARESGLRTSWTERDEEYERAVQDFTDQGPCGVQADDIARFDRLLDPYARANSLGAALLHLTMPGVPDVYQGSEFPVHTLVDPDNRGTLAEPEPGTRRTAVHASLRRLLQGEPPTGPDEVKLLLTALALRLRRAHPQWYGPGGGYQPLTADGPAAGHCVAFARGGGAVTAVTRLSRRLERSGGWRTTTLAPPPGDWRDLLTGTPVTGPVPLRDLFAVHPVALLTRA